MIWLRRLLISVAIAGAVGAGGYFLYNTAFISGETAGYDNGYDEGREIGYALGETEGYREGETAGYQSGKTDGYNEGESAGYSTGLSDGYDDGYDDGYLEAISAGYEQGYDAGVEDGLGHGYTLRDLPMRKSLPFWGRTQPMRMNMTWMITYAPISPGMYAIMLRMPDSTVPLLSYAIQTAVTL